MEFKRGEKVIWNRKPKGGMRRVTPLEVVVVGSNDVAVLVTRTRRGRVLQHLVPAERLEPLNG